MQKTINPYSAVLVLILTIKSKFSTKYFACCRLLKLQTIIDAIPELKKTAMFWKQLTELCEIMEPFAFYTAFLQKDDACVNQVWVALNENKNSLFVTNEKLPANEKEIIAQKIEQTWKTHYVKHMNNFVICATRLFSGENIIGIEYQDLPKAIIEWGTIFLDFYKFFPPLKKEELSQKLTLTLGDFIQRKNIYIGFSRNIS